MEVNRLQKHILSARILAYFGDEINNKTIAIWGLAFKPNTDDIREAPALTIIDDLLKAGAKVRVFDPEAMDNVKTLFGKKLEYGDNQYDILKGADALAIITEWSVFRTPDYIQMKSLLRHPAVFDGRNVFVPERMLQLGFDYFSIGRPFSM